MRRPHTGVAMAREASDEEKFRRLIEAGADGMLVVMHDGTIGFVNPSACEILGRPDCHLVGEPFGIPLVPGETTEIDARRPDGEVRVAEMRTAVTTWQGRPAYLASLRDITERKRAEEALREADRRKDEFLAMLAHELRNPLAAINNAVNVASRTASPADQAWSREVIGHQCRHLGRLVDDLLDVSRITRGKIQLRRERVELAPILERACEAVRPLIDERGHVLFAPRVPFGIWLDADPARLEQVVINLLANAAKYTEPGGRIALSACLEGAEVVVRVTDNGVGLPAEAIPRMFELFAQGERTLARSEGGLGIGLTLVRSLVELHGGSVTATSPGPGLGSTFTVRLPAIDPTRPATESAPSVPPVEGRAARILIVDDHVESAEGMLKLLEHLGHEARMVHDGASALDAAAEFRPEIVLLDIGLPGMDGYAVASQLRADPRLARPLIIAVSGYGQEADRARSQEAGMDYHLIKPVDIETLIELLDRHTSSGPSCC